MQAEAATRSILESLRRLVRELRLFSRRTEDRFGLSAAQLFVLQRVAEHQPLSINALAELTYTHQSSVSDVAGRLEQRGLLSRRPSAQDARCKAVTITAAGRRALRRAPIAVQDRIIAAAAAMDTRDRRALARLLTQLVRQMGLQDAHAALFFEEQDRPRPPRRDGKASNRRRKHA